MYNKNSWIFQVDFVTITIDYLKYCQAWVQVQGLSQILRDMDLELVAIIAT